MLISEIDLYVHKLAQMVRCRADLKPVIDSEFPLETRDNKEMSVAMVIAAEGSDAQNTKANCDYLSQYGDIWEDCACGAALANKRDWKLYVEALIAQKKTPKYERIAIYAAMGGHHKLTLYLIKKSKHDAESLNAVVRSALVAGHYKLADTVMKLIPEEQRQYADYAARAAYGNNHKLVSDYFEKVDKTNPNTIYKIAAFAAMNSHLALCESWLSKLPEGQQRNDLYIACFAAHNGQKVIALAYLERLPETESKYFEAAVAATMGGFFSLAMDLMKLIKDKSKRDYESLAKEMEKYELKWYANRIRILSGTKCTQPKQIQPSPTIDEFIQRLIACESEIKSLKSKNEQLTNEQRAMQQTHNDWLINFSKSHNGQYSNLSQTPNLSVTNSKDSSEMPIQGTSLMSKVGASSSKKLN